METKKLAELLGAVGSVVAIVVVLALGPLLTLWALNTLFPALNIPYNFSTWAAVAILGAAIKTNVKVNK
jgi:hypothetical protein